MRNNKLQKGQSLFELVVAIAVSALIITAIVALASASIQNSSFSRDKNIAANYVQQLNEWLRGQRNAGTAEFTTRINTAPTWCFKDLSWTSFGTCGQDGFITDTKFKRETTFIISPVNGQDVVEISTIVSWEDSKGIHQVTGATDLSL